MKIVVIGGSGLIGSKLCKKLAARARPSGRGGIPQVRRQHRNR